MIGRLCKEGKSRTSPILLTHHVNLGIPNVKMITCRKIQTSTGPLFRNGGFILMKDGEFQLYFLHQIYKDDDGYSVAVAEVMRDVSTSFPDAFLREMEIRTWKNYWITFSRWIFLFKLEIFKCKLQLMMVPLLHACLVENPRVCGIRRAAHSVTEEREVLQMK